MVALKRILMLLPNGFDPDPRVYNEARSLVNAGHHVKILCWDREATHPFREKIDEIEIERISIKSSYGRGSPQLIYLLRFWYEAFRRGREFGPNIIHSHDFNTLPLGYWLGKKLQIPVFFDAHESYYEMLAENVHPVIKWAIARAECYLVKRIRLLITVGSILEEEYERRGAKKTAVIGNWKRPNDFNFSVQTLEVLKKELNIPSNRLVLSYVGYLLPPRGLMPLIEAVRGDEKAFLVIGGKGVLEKKISIATEDVPNIRFLGYISPDRVPLITAASDVIYYGLTDDSKNNRYSAPNKLFEALASGKAVLTGTIGEIGRIVKEEQCGITLDRITPETIREAFALFKKPDVLNQFKRNAAIAGQNKYNWSIAERKLLEIYKYP